MEIRANIFYLKDIMAGEMATITFYRPLLQGEEGYRTIELSMPETMALQNLFADDSSGKPDEPQRDESRD